MNYQISINSTRKFQAVIDSPSSDMPVESIYDRICKSIIFNLGTVIQGQEIGDWVYQNTLGDITDESKSPENFSQLPGVNVFYGEEVCKNNRSGFLQTGGFNRQILEMQFELQLDIFGQANNRSQWCKSIKADLLALFGNNYQINDQDGNTTALTVLYNRSKGEFLKITTPNVWLQIDFTVHYRMNRVNPSELMN